MEKQAAESMLKLACQIRAHAEDYSVAQTRGLEKIEQLQNTIGTIPTCRT